VSRFSEREKNTFHFCIGKYLYEEIGESFLSRPFILGRSYNSVNIVTKWYHEEKLLSRPNNDTNEFTLLRGEAK